RSSVRTRTMLVDSSSVTPTSRTSIVLAPVSAAVIACWVSVLGPSQLIGRVIPLTTRYGVCGAAGSGLPLGADGDSGKLDIPFSSECGWVVGPCRITAGRGRVCGWDGYSREGIESARPPESSRVGGEDLGCERRLDRRPAGPGRSRV